MRVPSEREPNLFFFFTHIYFPASGQAVVTGVVPSSPRFLPSILSRIGFRNPTARRFSSSVANSRSRAFRKSVCAQEKVPTTLYEYAPGGIRTHETDQTFTLPRLNSKPQQILLSYFWAIYFLNNGPPQPKMVEMTGYFFALAFVCIPIIIGHGLFHRVAFSFYSKSDFG